jgi:predicted acetyltransferase
MDLEIRPPNDAEFEAFRAALARGFGRHPRNEPEEAALFKQRFERERSLAVFDGSQVVGTTGIHSFEMTVPGGASLPAAGVTMVTVAATHRRQGILRKMMMRQLADIRDRKEPLAILWASESAIYGRFGYGMAIQHERWSIERRHAAFASQPFAPGKVRFVTEQEAREVFPEVWERARPVRPGMVRRAKPWWDNFFYDPEHRRFGGGAYFFAVYEESGLAEGYVAYRIRMNWQDGQDAHEVFVAELVTASDAALAALWKFCLNIDLTVKLETWGRPVDDPLWWMLADPRRLHRIPHDAIWIRLLDVPDALSARSYPVAGNLVLEVRDDFGGPTSGRYAIEGAPEGAVCRPSRAEPDLVLGVAELAAVYMGGHKLSPLARAGRVEEQTPRALARADAMFAWDVAPWCPQGF